MAKSCIRSLIATNQSSPGRIDVEEKNVFLYLCDIAGITEIAAAIQVLRGASQETRYNTAVFGSA